jgi:flagellar biosynthesis protein FliQ
LSYYVALAWLVVITVGLGYCLIKAAINGSDAAVAFIATVVVVFLIAMTGWAINTLQGGYRG